jgi:hypothetical protein
LYRKTPRKRDIFYKLPDTMVSVTDLARTAWSYALGLNSSNSKIEAGDIWKVVANGRVAEKLSGEYSNMAPTYGVWAHQFETATRLLPPRSWPCNTGVLWEYEKGLNCAHEKLVATGVYNLKVFATNTSYVSSSYATARGGDLICILFGCQLPVMIRPAENGDYILVDAVYVDGIMGWKFLKSATSERKFVLV